MAGSSGGSDKTQYRRDPGAGCRERHDAAKWGLTRKSTCCLMFAVSNDSLLWERDGLLRGRSVKSRSHQSVHKIRNRNFKHTIRRQLLSQRQTATHYVKQSLGCRMGRGLMRRGWAFLRCFFFLLKGH